MFDMSKVMEWLKLSTKQAFVLAVLSSILLFASDSLIEDLGLLTVKNASKPWLGAVWLISVSILAAEIFQPVYAWISERIRWRLNLKRYQRRLHDLTPDEKGFLAVYLRENTRTQPAAYSNGTVNGLVSANVILIP